MVAQRKFKSKSPHGDEAGIPNSLFVNGDQVERSRSLQTLNWAVSQREKKDFSHCCLFARVRWSSGKTSAFTRDPNGGGGRGRGRGAGAELLPCRRKARAEQPAEVGGAGLADTGPNKSVNAAGAEVCPQTADVNSSAVPRSEANQEVALPGPSGGGVKPEEAGGVGDETGLRQEAEHKGGDQGGDGSAAAPAPHPPADAAAAVAVTRRRRSAARRYLAAANSPARQSGAGHSPASGIAETVTQTTAAQTPAPGSPHPATVALRCPLPPSSNSDDSGSDPSAVNCSRKKRSQNKIQRSNTLQQKIAQLATLSNRQAQPVEPPTRQQLALPAVLKNPLQS
nr:cuticle collagen 36-like [Taeniopygia guttata]